MKRKVFFRADGGTGTGLGHIVRCCALADMLKADFECHFFIREPAPNIQRLILESCVEVHPMADNVTYNNEASLWAASLSGNEIVVLDGYDFATEYQNPIKQTGAKVVCIDDIHASPFVADAVINHAPGVTTGSYAVEPYTSVLLGTDFLLLRQPFLNAVEHRREKKEINSLFVCFGGSDFNNLTGKALQAAIQAGKFKQINLVVGDAYQHIGQLEADIQSYCSKGHIRINLHRNVPAATMVEIITTSDVAICPCSSILFEACAVGIGLISGFYVDNQKFIYEHLDQKGIFTGVGDFNTIDTGSLAERISNFDPGRVNQQISLQKDLVDGRSPYRLKKLFHKLDKEFAVNGRKVAETDVETLFEWANDPETRANAINANPIPWEDHVRWFTKKIGDANSHMFIFEHVNTGKRIGLTRFDPLEGDYLISYLVDKDHRGLGWGEIILKLGIKGLMEATGNRQKLRAMVKEDNIASSQVFVNLGFLLKEPVVMDNITYRVYEK